MFAGDVAIALGRTLAEVFAMPAAEFAFWRLYFSRRGFPTHRIEGAVAVAGTAMCRMWGAKSLEPKDLIPRFGQERVSNKVLAARLARLPGAKVTRIPRPERKAGQAKDASAEECAAPRPRLLNPKKPKLKLQRRKKR